MSSQLVWELVKKNTCFMKQNAVGHRDIFSTEAGNVASKHSYKYSGLVNANTVDVQAGEGLSLKLVKSRKKNANKPASAKTTVVTKRRVGRQLASISKEVGYLRPDLKLEALRKASALHRAQVKANKTS